jgi:hypothetical protein
MEDHQSPSQGVPKGGGDIPSQIRKHLKKYIIHKQFMIQLNDLLTEAASFRAQLKILALFKSQNLGHTFRVCNDYEESISNVKDRAITAIQSEKEEATVNTINKICEKDKLGKTTLYADFRADSELRELWKKRVKSVSKAKKDKKQTDTKMPNEQTISLLEESQMQEIEKDKNKLTSPIPDVQDDFFLNLLTTDRAQFSPFLEFETEAKEDLTPR